MLKYDFVRMAQETGESKETIEKTVLNYDENDIFSVSRALRGTPLARLDSVLALQRLLVRLVDKKVDELESAKDAEDLFMVFPTNFIGNEKTLRLMMGAEAALISTWVSLCQTSEEIQEVYRILKNYNEDLAVLAMDRWHELSREQIAKASTKEDLIQAVKDAPHNSEEKALAMEKLASFYKIEKKI
jgi:hypothetical protein